MTDEQHRWVQSSSVIPLGAGAAVVLAMLALATAAAAPAEAEPLEDPPRVASNP